MINIRQVIRGMTPLLVLAISVVGASTASAEKKGAGGGGGAPQPDPVGAQGSPLWVFLVVAAIAVVVTLIAERLVTRLHAAAT